MKLARSVSFVVLAALAAGICAGESAGEWTQWGGPRQAFRADSAGLAGSWPAEGPRKIWTRALGDGYSAILFDAGKLYTMYRDGGEEVVVSLDAADGSTVWEHRYAAAPGEGHVAQFGEGPRSTPVILGDRVYTVGVSGMMHCLEKKSGKAVWSRDLWKEFGGNFLNHGYSSSPVGYGKTVIVPVGGDGAGIIALDAGSGEPVWKSSDFRNSYSTPKLLQVDGKDQMVVFMAAELVAFDPRTGGIEWSYPIENQWGQNICMPVMADANHLFLSTTEAGARGLKLTRDGEKTNVEEIWSTRKIQFYHVSTVQDGDWVYGVTGARAPNFFAAVNIKTGEIAWRERGFAKANVVAADGKVIVLGEDGKLALTTATPEGLTVHSEVELLDGTAWTVPTLVGKTLYVRDKANIMALDLG
jgi:outer membrane protein assembly factor BamB